MNLKKLFLTFFIMSSVLLLIGCIEDETNNGRYDIYVGADINNGFLTIQEAIDNASNGESIFIYNGIYNEKIVINKSINITGESNLHTIIDHKDNEDQEINFITLLADNCVIDNIYINNTLERDNVFGIVIKSSNNTIINTSISNTEKAVFIDSDYNQNSRNNSIILNNFSNNNYGLHITYSNDNNITQNNIFKNIEYGIYLLNSNNNFLSFNNYVDNKNYGLRIKGSRNNIFSNNKILSNQKGLYFCCGARDNIVYNNNFQDNIDWHANDGLGNQWDNGIIGNYWADYLEKYPNSESNNGIWLIPYNITGGSYKDNYPLTNPI